MDFEHSEKVRSLIAQVEAFMDVHVYPLEAGYRQHFETTENRWTTPPMLLELREKARAKGLWNLFYPAGHGKDDALTNLEYAPLAEIMGRVIWSSEVFNCNAPDTGNMETLILYGTDAAVLPHDMGGWQFAIMVERGMAPMDAIRSATSVAAKHMEMSADVGAIDVGRFGDLIAVRGDPLDNMNTMRNVDVVIKGGLVFKMPSE